MYDLEHNQKIYLQMGYELEEINIGAYNEAEIELLPRYEIAKGW